MVLGYVLVLSTKDEPAIPGVPLLEGSTYLHDLELKLRRCREQVQCVVPHFRFDGDVQVVLVFVVLVHGEEAHSEPENGMDEACGFGYHGRMIPSSVWVGIEDCLP